MSDEQPILIVEDDEDIRESLVDAFQDQGYAVVSAVDGLDALDQLRNVRPRLILLDLMMPRMNGMQFCEEKQKVDEWAAIPVVVLSADARAKERAAACGAATYLMKPVKLGSLFATVARVLGSG